MRKLSKQDMLVLSGVALVVVLGALYLRPRTVKALDVINETQPNSRAFENIQSILDTLKTMDPAQRTAYLRSAYPRLETDVVHYLRLMQRIPEDAKNLQVEFLFGSLDNVKAESGDGTIKQGYFKDQLLARVSYDGGETRTYAVKCLNGMVDLPPDFGQRLQSLGSFEVEEVFTIGPREGLAKYVAYMTAIDLAEKHGLPLYKGKVLKPEFQITPVQARELAKETGKVQITVLVFEGDQFNTATGEYTSANKR